ANYQPAPAHRQLPNQKPNQKPNHQKTPPRNPTKKPPATLCCLTKKAEPPPTRDVNRDSGTDSANGGWLRRLVRQQNIHDSIKPVNRKPIGCILLAARNRRELLFKAIQPTAANSNQNSPANYQPAPAHRQLPNQKPNQKPNHQKTPPRNPTKKPPATLCCLTKKAEPPPTRDVNRDSGTDSANGGWLRRLVRQQNIHDSIKPVNRKPIGCILLAARNRRELLFKAIQPTAANSNQNSPANYQPAPAHRQLPNQKPNQKPNHQKTPPRNPTKKPPATLCCLTKKAEPPPTRDVNRDSG